MKNHPFLALSLVMFVFAGAAQAESYQVTGPVLELTDSKIVVEKGKEKWAIARSADTKVTGDLKVGGKVTVHYTMTATSIESKEKAAPDKEPAKEKAKPEAKPAPAAPAKKAA